MTKEMSPEERKLIDKIAQMVGYVPEGWSDLLHILSHPDVRELAYDYLMAVENGD